VDHLVLTRACYAPDVWDDASNARRLEYTANVTVPSLAEQTVPWTWVVALDIGDRLLVERRKVFRSAGAEVDFLEVYPAPVRGGRRSSSDNTPAERVRVPRLFLSESLYDGDWLRYRTPGGPLITTRLDDDDAFACDALSRIQTAARLNAARPKILMLPQGVRISGRRFSEVTHHSNAMSSRYDPEGVEHIYSLKHRNIQTQPHVMMVDDLPGWLWVRHRDTLEGFKYAELPLDELPAKIRDRFPSQTWDFLQQQVLSESVAKDLEFP